MLEELYSTTSLVQGIEGKVTAELFDATNGKLVQREETHNFIAKPAVDFLRQAQRTIFKKGIYTLNNSAMQDYQLLDKQNSILVLSALSEAEDVENETHMYGRPIGYARRETYSGSNTMLGSVNVELSTATPERVTWVFDWPTHAANGVINSVGWAKSLITNFNSSNYPGFTIHGSYIVAPSTTDNGAYGFGLASSLVTAYSPVADGAIGVICKGPGGNQSYFAALPSERYNNFPDGYVSASYNSYNVHVYDANMHQTATFSVQSSGIGYARGLTWDNVNSRLWVLGTGLKLSAYTSAGIAISGTTVPIPSGGLYRGLAFDGEYLWVGDNSGTTYTSASVGKLWQIDPADGSVVSGFTFPQAYIYSGSSAFANTIKDISFDQEKSVLWVRTAPYDYSNLSQPPNFANEIKAFTVDGSIAAYSVIPSPWTGLSGVGTTSGYASGQSNFNYGRPSGSDTYDNYDEVAVVDLSGTSTSGMGCEYIGNNMFMICNSSSSTSNRCYKILADGLGSRALLSSPIAKTDSQTLRITYQVNFS